MLRQKVIVEAPKPPGDKASKGRTKGKAGGEASVAPPAGSGSFSVGALPKDLPEPRGNTLFPGASGVEWSGVGWSGVEWSGVEWIGGTMTGWLAGE